MASIWSPICQAISRHDRHTDPMHDVFHPHFGSADSAPPKGVWRPLLRSRLVGRAEPLYIGAGGLRSAASIWSGAQVWAQLLRSQPGGARVVVCQADRLALLQLLVAVLWDGRTLQVNAGPEAPLPFAWCLDGRQVEHDGQPICRLGDGGWPDLAGPARLSIRDMLTVAPEEGDIAVRGLHASHGDLWLALGAPLGHVPSATSSTGQREPTPRSEVLAEFDLTALVTPQDLLNDALLPLLQCAEVWEQAALPSY